MTYSVVEGAGGGVPRQLMQRDVTVEECGYNGPPPNAASGTEPISLSLAYSPLPTAVPRPAVSRIMTASASTVRSFR